MRILASIVFLLAALGAAAAQQVSPAEAAIQVTTIINQMAQLATNQQRTIEGQQKQIADLQKQLADKAQPAPQK